MRKQREVLEGRRRARILLGLLPALASQVAIGQSTNSGESPAEPKPAPAASTEQLAPVQITGSRPDDVQERRSSAAAKIVIGREEIDRFGDSTLGDVLKRLPGVTIQGRPGRGGEIRLRGLGSGYTQRCRT